MAKPPLPPGKDANPRHKTRSASKSKVVTNADVKEGRRTLNFLMRAYEISDASATLKEFTETSDRSSAILLAASVERMLEFAIMARLPKQDKETKDDLVKREGPLNSLSSKIILAFAMGIIPETLRDDLNTIRKVRNVFAHSALRIDFNTQEILEECKSLPKLITIDDIDNTLERNYAKLSKPRRRYTIACVMAWLYLFLRTMPKQSWDKSEFSQNWRDQVAKFTELFKIPEHTTPA